MRRVIIVDDEPITRMDLSEILAEQGFEVAGEAGDGFDAIELCRQKKPEIVLMDVKMPVFDGISAAKTIISQDLADCVVMLTAFSDEELIAKANAAGVTGYLIKPIEERLLKPTIEVALAQSNRLKKLRQEAKESRRLLEENKLIEQAKNLYAKENGVSENEAYQMLRKMSMDKRCTIAAISKVIVENSSTKDVVKQAKEILIKEKGVMENAAFKMLRTSAQRKGLTIAQAAREVIEAHDKKS